MLLSTLFQHLAAAGVQSVRIEPASGDVRIYAPEPLPVNLRDAVATHKHALLRFAGDAPLHGTPSALAKRYTPAPYKVGGYSSAECDVWLAENGWTRDARGQWVDPTSVAALTAAKATEQAEKTIRNGSIDPLRLPEGGA